MSEGENLLRRVGDVRAVLYEHHADIEEELPFVAVICDDCGLAKMVFGAILPSTIDYEFREWLLSSERPYHDLCPDCR